jgi:hypothetical protein
MKVVPVTDTVNCTGAPPEEYNAPVLATGMTPVIWDSVNEEWDETTESDPEWYSYTTTDKPKEVCILV